MELFILCIKVFFVRILDVSMGTIRTIITIKGNKFVATLIGFFEALIWFIVVKEALTTDIKSIWIALFYSAGFAVGTYVGTILSDKFISGKMCVQIILNKNDNVISDLRNEGYAVSVLDVKGYKEDKYLLFIEIDNRKYKKLINLIKKLDSKAFIVTNETKHVMNGYFGTVWNFFDKKGKNFHTNKFCVLIILVIEMNNQIRILELLNTVVID